MENSSVAENEIYSFLKKARANHLLGCGGNLITGYSYEDGNFNYQTTFRGDLKSLLKLEEIYFSDTFVGRQVSTGYLKE